MKKLLVSLAMICLTVLPAISQSAVQKIALSPEKYELGKYNFNLSGQEETVTIESPVKQIEQPQLELKETTRIIEKTTPVKINNSIPQTLEQNSAPKKENINQIKYQENIKDRNKNLKKPIQQTTVQTRQTLNSTKAKAQAKQSEKDVKYDPDKPPFKFMIVPIQYKGEMTKTIEQL